MTERPFKMAFHDSEAQGPPEPEHLMYKTHASTRAIWWPRRVWEPSCSQASLG